MDLLKDYPAHLYDPIRRGIAEMYIKHELRKFFPSVRDITTWQQIDVDVDKWYSGSPSFAPVRDFWNGLHGISMGFKLKNVVTRLTSKNVKWELNDVAVTDLSFGANFVELKALGNHPRAVDVQEYLFSEENKDILNELKKRDVLESEKTFNRDKDPIIVSSPNKELSVVDGNRRLLHAIITNQLSIKAYTGTVVSEPELFEYWVPTSSLIDLVANHRYFQKQNESYTLSVAVVIGELVKNSAAGRIELVHRVFNNNYPHDQILWSATNDYLKQHSVTLDKFV